MNIPFIEFRGVSKQFGANKVLDCVDLRIYEGEVTTIIGLSGSGKSVLLKHIIGLLKPDEGEVLFQGKPLSKMSKSEQNITLSRISYMFQQNALFDSMTVYENIAFPLQEKTNLAKKEIDKRVMARIAQTELTEAAQQYPSELSGGMQKRAALARALVTDPKAVLFDEPTTGQDPVRKNAILSMIAQYQRKFGFTAILVSHEIPDVYFISNRILALYQRKIVFQGSPEEFEDFKHPFQDEVIQSLEKLQQELTGMYSKRQFILQNHSLRKRLRNGEMYTILVYTIRKSELMTENIEKFSFQESIKDVELCIVDYFNNLGGFSARLNISEFVTIMPYSRIDEAEGMFKDFLENLNKRKLKGDIIAEINADHSKYRIEFTLMVGFAEGNTDMDIAAVVDSARAKQKETVRLYRDVRR
jgi:phospholipid/cholesterol/gamma-HCH transport system ATP-binding protein